MSQRPLLSLLILAIISIGGVIGLLILIQGRNTEDIAIPPKDVSDFKNNSVAKNEPTEKNEPKQNAWSVSTGDFFFDPSDAAVEVGSSITWINNGGEPHRVAADDGEFDSGALNPGDSFTVVFDRPGKVTYHCAIHPSMAGSVTVGSDGGGTATGSG
jgi:plastocyanin